MVRQFIHISIDSIYRGLYKQNLMYFNCYWVTFIHGIEIALDCTLDCQLYRESIDQICFKVIKLCQTVIEPAVFQFAFQKQGRCTAYSMQHFLFLNV